MTEGTGNPGTMADVSHAHPETAETFWAVYRRGPAVADGGRREPRRNGADPDDATADDATDGNPSADGSDRRTMADVNHEPPYPEPADVWTRGGGRVGDGGAGDEGPDV